MIRKLTITLIVLFAILYAAAQESPLTIFRGTINIPDCDSVLVTLYRCPTVSYDRFNAEMFSMPLTSGHFEISFDSLVNPFYVNIFPMVKDGVVRLVNRGNFLLGMPGDQVHFSVTNDTVTVSGQGKDKYVAKLLCDKISYWPGKPSPGEYSENMDTLLLHQRELYYDSIYVVKERVLDRHRSVLTDREYLLLESDLTTERSKVDFTAMDAGLTLSPIKIYREYLANLYLRKYARPDTTGWADKVYSNRYAAILFNAMFMGEQLRSGGGKEKGKPDLDTLFFDVMADYSGLLREKLLIALLARFKSRPNLDEYIDKMKPMIENRYLLDELAQYQQLVIRSNATVPVRHLSFVAEDGSIIDSTHTLGKITLLDFWFIGCGACAIAKNRLENTVSQLARHEKFQLISVSIDDRNKWLSSLEKGTYTFPFGHHVYTGGVGSDHPLINYYHIIGFPTFMLIDEAGKLIKITKSVSEVEDILGRYL